ncbi:hypothetical protein ACHWQZ_G016027 [Mnemiopsis leidyi]
MSFKKRGERSELGPKQKHNALVPIKSVHSNFLLEKDKTKRVKIINDEQHQTSKRLETRAEAMIETQHKSATPNRHLQKRLERAFNVLSVNYSDNSTESFDDQLPLYGMKSLNTKLQKQSPTITNGNRKKKINSKLEFDGCIFNNKAAEAVEEKKRKPFPSFGIRSSEPSFGNKTKLYGEDVIITASDPSENSRCPGCHNITCCCLANEVYRPVTTGRSMRKYSIFKQGVFKNQTGLAVVGVQRVLSPPSTCTFVKNRRQNELKND